MVAPPASGPADNMWLWHANTTCSKACNTAPVTRVVHVPYAVEHDEDGVWCASAQLRPGVAAFGDGPTREEAVADLRAGLELLIGEVGIPDELTLTLNVA
jgi:predicted RNase H-like HicB family nuclease